MRYYPIHTLLLPTYGELKIGLLETLFRTPTEAVFVTAMVVVPFAVFVGFWLGKVVSTRDEASDQWQVPLMTQQQYKEWLEMEKPITPLAQVREDSPSS